MTESEAGSGGAVQRLIAAGGNMAGAAFGAIVGGASGDPSVVVLGAVAGSVLGSTVDEIAMRVLSERQQKRVGAVVVEALAVIRAKEVMGETLRADGFFDGDRSDGDEFIEGVLRAAMDEFEERKLRYLANLLANVCIEVEVDLASANATLRLAEQLSWMELQMLGIFWATECESKYVLPDLEMFTEVDNWFEATVNQTYIDLNDKHRLIRHASKPTSRLGLAGVDLNLSAVRLTNPGRLVAGLMELQQIPRVEVTPVLEAMTKLRAPEPEAGA